MDLGAGQLKDQHTQQAEGLRPESVDMGQTLLCSLCLCIPGRASQGRRELLALHSVAIQLSFSNM